MREANMPAGGDLIWAEASAVPAPRFLIRRHVARFPRKARERGAKIGLLGLRNDSLVIGAQDNNGARRLMG